jgi:epoxyqueuosine reductase
MSLSTAIKEAAHEIGFHAVGIGRVNESHQPSALGSQPEPLAELFYRRLSEWLRRGYHGAMAWMGRTPERRTDPGLVLPGCRSIVSVGLNYDTGHRADERPGHGRIARYTWGEDYHRVFERKLADLEAAVKTIAPDARTRSYADTGPVMEKAWAQQAGLGWIGKHSNLVSPQFGSWLLLGEILTTLELEPDTPGSDLCGSCTLCIKACPTGAIVEPYVVDARRCISYLTIELHGPNDQIPEAIRPKLGNRIFGCDDCLDVCPYNAQASLSSEPAFQPTPLALAPRLTSLAGMTASDFAETFRNSAIRRAKHHGFLRNVHLALRNECDMAERSQRALCNEPMSKVG